MSALTVSKSTDYEAYRKSVKDFSEVKLEDTYRNSKLTRATRLVSLKTGTIIVSLFAIPILNALAASLALTLSVGIGLISLNAGIAIYSSRSLQKDNLKEKVIQDFFHERKKQVVFSTDYFMLSGCESKITEFSNSPTEEKKPAILKDDKKIDLLKKPDLKSSKTATQQKRDWKKIAMVSAAAGIGIVAGLGYVYTKKPDIYHCSCTREIQRNDGKWIKCEGGIECSEMFCDGTKICTKIS